MDWGHIFLPKDHDERPGVVLASWDVVGVHEAFKDCRQIRRQTFPAIFITATLTKMGTAAELPSNTSFDVGLSEKRTQT